MYQSFRNNRLFAPAGPAETDVNQGSVGDCYFVATLSATARANPNRIRQMAVDLGDGTCAVQFFRNNQAHFVRVDGDLPALSGSPAYAGLGG
jgi:hypothetical protein